MSNKILKSNIKKTNFFDGQRVSEADLDDNQKYFEDLIFSSNVDFHSSGVLKKSLNQRIILDTSNPSAENPSVGDINARNFDGLALSADRQPLNSEYGVRLEVELLNSDARGRELQAKVLIVGVSYDPQYSSGLLKYEVLTFDDNKTLLTENHYIEVKTVILNNISIGSGTNDALELFESKNLGGDVIIREADSAKIFAKSESIKSKMVPNFDLQNMYGRSGLSAEINSGVNPTNSVQELFINYESEKHSFDPGAPIGIAYGQKFIAQSNNIQKVELLMSVEYDLTHGLDWEGDLVFSLYELEDPKDKRSSNPLDGNPKFVPIAEISLDQEDLEAKGYKLGSSHTKIEIDFSSSRASDPKSEAIKRGHGYAIMVARSGANNFGTINVFSGENEVLSKKNNSIGLSIQENFENQKSEFVEFDPNYTAYISDEEKSLWFSVHSLQFEITSGMIYDKEGVVFSIPELDDYVAESKINFKMEPIDLADKFEKNIIGVSSSDKFSNPDVHPRTGNFVYTRMQNYPKISVFASNDPENNRNDYLVLGTVQNNSPLSTETLSITLDKPCLADRDFLYVVNPSNQILQENLIGRKLLLDQSYSQEYLISKVERLNLKYGDIDDSGLYSSTDLQYILDISGSAVNSSETQRSILGGEIDIIDFIKSDLNGDGIVDGEDISLMETALSGAASFPVGKNLIVLKVYFESEIVSNENKEIQSFSSISTNQADTTITIPGFTEQKALMVRVGDLVHITSGLNEGEYTVASKSVDSDGTTVELGLKDELGDTYIFSAETQNTILILSKNTTNAFLDNPNLLNTPFQTLNSVIYFNNYFQERNLDVCDLRPFLDFSFQEDESKSCLCPEEETDCDPKKVNHKYMPGDLFIDGRIRKRDGSEYSGDYEFSNVVVDLPVGTLSGCKIDLYNTFVKSEGNTCFTSAGYDAMKYSDGTYVGCEDSGSNTDISKGRVKIVGGLASLHIDAFVDGYEVDEDQGITEFWEPEEVINETSTNYIYTKFNGPTPTASWNKSAFSGKFYEVEPSSGPLTLGVKTHSVPGTTSASMTRPIEIGAGLENDFIFDFQIKIEEVKWPDYDLLNGSVEFYFQINIDNGSLGNSIARLGYRVASGVTKVFFYAEKFDSGGVSVASTATIEVDTVGIPGEKIRFRIRRRGEDLYAYHVNPNEYIPDTNPSQQFEKVGQFFGAGSGVTDQTEFIVNNNAATTPNLDFAVSLFEVDMHSDYFNSTGASSYTISRDSSTDSMSRLLLTLPFPYKSNIKILEANLIFNSTVSAAVNADLLFTPFVNLNATNPGNFYNYSKESNSTSREVVHIANVTSGNEIRCDLLGLFRSFQSKTGHIPGQKKAFLVEFDPTNVGSNSISFDDEITMEYIYEDYTTGVVFQIGVDVDPRTGIATFKTRNVLYDLADKSKRTRVNFGVHLKKSGFANKDIEVSVSDLQRLKYGIGSCIDNSITEATPEGDCFFVMSDASTGTFVDGPFPCNYYSSASGTPVNPNTTVEIDVTAVHPEFVFDSVVGPNLNLYEGVTYVFNVSDSSMGSRQLRFRDSSTGTEITSGFSTTGTPGAAGAEVVLTVQEGSGTLEYFDAADPTINSGTVFTPTK